MKKTYQKLICYALSTCIISSIALSSPSKVYASDLNNKSTETISKQHDKEVLTRTNLKKVKSNETHTTSQKVFTKEEIEKMQSEIQAAKKTQGILFQNKSMAFADGYEYALLGIYEIPGIGEVALATTGVIIVGGSVLYIGSYVYTKVMEWIASSNELVDVSDRSNWEEKDIDDILDDVHGEKGNTTKGWDGTVKTDVNDTETGEKIGEIHQKQPEYDDDDKYTGKNYPRHYHDKDNRLGNGSDYHWYW